jgi:glycosyltransferase A (GT-A) superfamily protein (DUF2064 family)
MSRLPAAPLPTLVVFGRLPTPGLCKTRLTPPFSPQEAADLYAAMLDDALRAASLCPAVDVLFVADGPHLPREYRGIATTPQEGVVLTDRLANAFRLSPGPSLLMATDVPQVRTNQLRRAVNALAEGVPRAVLGPTEDGGFWCLGLSGTDADFLHDVDLTSSRCAEEIVAVLRRDGVSTTTMPEVLRDIDDVRDAETVATDHPRLGFSRAFRRVTSSQTP